MKTKNLILVFLVAFTTNYLFSQDVIIKTNNSKINARIFEVQNDLIKYKPFDFLEGPLRNISVSEVSRIVYENGRVETFVFVAQPNTMPLPVISPSETNNVGFEKTSQPSEYPLRLFIRGSIQFWDNSEVSDFFGNNPLFGAGIEKQLSDDFKFGADLDFASKEKYQTTVTYFQFGGFFKYSWYPFGSKRPNVCGGLGLKGISIKEDDEGKLTKGSSVGFSVLLGVEIPLGEKVILDCGWNTVWSKVDFGGMELNLGSEVFSLGIIFNLW